MAEFDDNTRLYPPPPLNDEAPEVSDEALRIKCLEWSLHREYMGVRSYYDIISEAKSFFNFVKEGKS